MIFKILIVILMFTTFISGLGCIVYAAFLFSKISGYLILGSVLIFISYLLDDTVEHLKIKGGK